MIAMAADGSQERFLTRKFLPFTAIFVLTASIVMIGFGVGMIVHEKTQTAPIILVVAGSIGIPLGCVGLYWWIKKRTFDEMEKPLIWFIGLLIVVSVPTLVAGCLGILEVNKVLDVNKKPLLKDDFKADLEEQMKLYGKTGHYEILRNIDRLQKEGKCCGAINYADWRRTAYGGGRYDKVPDSCCKVDHRRHACGFEFELSKINQKGCNSNSNSNSNSSSSALDGMKLHLKLVAYGGIICGIIEIILWIALLFLCLCGRSPSNKQQRQTYKKTESFSVHTLEEKEPRGVGAQDNQASAGEERPPDTQEKAF